jgi:hypothetical protein
MRATAAPTKPVAPVTRHKPDGSGIVDGVLIPSLNARIDRLAKPCCARIWNDM